MKQVLAEPDTVTDATDSASEHSKKLRQRRNQLLKDIADVKYGDDMKRAREKGNKSRVDSLRKKIKSMETEKKQVNDRLKSAS